MKRENKVYLLLACGGIVAIVLNNKMNGRLEQPLNLIGSIATLVVCVWAFVYGSWLLIQATKKAGNTKKSTLSLGAALMVASTGGVLAFGGKMFDMVGPGLLLLVLSFFLFVNYYRLKPVTPKTGADNG